jgi:hypothetical protein
MDTGTLVAFGCNLVAVLFTAAVSLRYLTAKKFMHYHRAALGRSWSDLDSRLQALLLAMMKGIGGYGLTITLAQLIALLIPFRHGEAWALWAVPIVGLVHASGSAYALTPIAGVSGKFPFIFSIGAGTLYAAGLCIALL